MLPTRRSLHLSLRDPDAGVPPRRSAVHRRCDLVTVEPDVREQPGDEGVRVPHVAGRELVPPPHGGGASRDQGQQRARLPVGGVQVARRVHRLVRVRDHSVAPTTDLVPEEARAAQEREAHGALPDDASLSGGRTPGRGHLHHEARSAEADQEGGVEQPETIATLQPGGDRLVRSAAPAHCRVAVGSQREPEQTHLTGRWGGMVQRHHVSPDRSVVVGISVARRDPGGTGRETFRRRTSGTHPSRHWYVDAPIVQRSS